MSKISTELQSWAEGFSSESQYYEESKFFNLWSSSEKTKKHMNI